ncbi:glycosyltransferase [Nonomuraea rubra]|uniref:glycosyltransferase n=1 Tax=Nonomuraea rubra TaxID=46180 RepID=UPI00360ED769
MITLSVVVPIRDGERFIADALTSLSRNARGDFEFIIVNDGSVDATGDIIDDFIGELPGLVVIRNPAPVGLADARNTGLSAATGRYVTYMDGDDWLAPGYLARLVEAIDGLGCDFVRVDHVQVEGRKRVVHRAPLARRGTVLAPATPSSPPTCARWWTTRTPGPACTGARWATCCTSPAPCTPPRTGRGSGGCTGRPPRSRWCRWRGCSTGAWCRGR